MADSTNKIDEHERTDATPAQADKTSVNNAMDAKANQPPVRTNRPDVPIAAVMTAGAGEHLGRVLEEREGYDGATVSVDADGVDSDGRVVAAAKK